MESKKRFDDALYGVSPAIRSVLEKLPDKVKESAEEIRLRSRSGETRCLCLKTGRYPFV